MRATTRLTWGLIAAAMAVSAVAALGIGVGVYLLQPPGPVRALTVAMLLSVAGKLAIDRVPTRLPVESVRVATACGICGASFGFALIAAGAAQIPLLADGLGWSRACWSSLGRGAATVVIGSAAGTILGARAARRWRRVPSNVLVVVACAAVFVSGAAVLTRIAAAWSKIPADRLVATSPVVATVPASRLAPGRSSHPIDATASLITDCDARACDVFVKPVTSEEGTTRPPTIKLLTNKTIEIRRRTDYLIVEQGERGGIFARDGRPGNFSRVEALENLVGPPIGWMIGACILELAAGAALLAALLRAKRIRQWLDDSLEGTVQDGALYVIDWDDGPYSIASLADGPAVVRRRALAGGLYRKQPRPIEPRAVRGGTIENLEHDRQRELRAGSAVAIALAWLAAAPLWWAARWLG